MPRQDKTGPDGKGTKTGRGMGICDKKIPIKINRKMTGKNQRKSSGKLD